MQCPRFREKCERIAVGQLFSVANFDKVQTKNEDNKKRNKDGISNSSQQLVQKQKPGPRKLGPFDIRSRPETHLGQ
jgi:hypothetical protein